jgi:hypothetical protein
MEGIGLGNENKFKTPQEELNFLRAEVAKREKEILDTGKDVNIEKVVSEKLEEYKKVVPEEALDKNYSIPKSQSEAIVLELAPETHDRKMEELVVVLHEKGLMNTISIVEKLKDPHLNDDFHRFLIQYIKAGFTFPGMDEKSPVFRALKMTLFEVSLPETKTDSNKQKTLKELVSKMEQFYSGMLSMDDKDSGYFSFELANSVHSDEFIFYFSVPDKKKDLFEKQLMSVFPEARVFEKKDDYNVFNEEGESLVSIVELEKKPALPIKSYEQYDYDPLNIILNSFSKIGKEDEGACIQIIVRPAGEYYNKAYKRVLTEVEKGKKLKEAWEKVESSVWNEIKKIGKELSSNGKKDEKEKTVDQDIVENIKNKLSSPIAKVNIKIITSAKTVERSASIMSEIESSFNQFENTTGNKFKFNRLSGKDLIKAYRDFSFRIFDEKKILPLNLKELTTIIHLPESEIKSDAQLKQTKAVSAPAPLDMPTEGIILGTNIHRNVSTEIRMTKEDRLRHFYVIGQTGTGKTTMLKNMIRQDILNGEGVCMIDPHGSDIQDVLSYVPKERYEDVIYFDPGHTERPMGLNMLEYDPRFPEQKTFVVNEMMSIFNKLFDMKTAGGPMFEQYFRNSVMLVLEDPESGCTLLDVSRVLANKSFREMKLQKCNNPIVVQFWREVAEKAGGEASLANIVPYITSKFDVFLSNEIMRPIIAQERSSFNFREIMDNKKILLVNLAKGRLGDINSNLIGLIVVGKLLMAALSRVDSFGQDLPPFYLYIDEFQNVTTDSISTILSEARKYKLSLTIAHQFIAQLEDKIKDSVFGNVGSMAVFRISSDDSEYLEKQFSPVFTAKDLMNIENYNAYVKMLSKGSPVKPFSVKISLPPRADKILLDKIKELSHLKFGRDRAEVEEEIMKKYRKEPAPAPTPTPNPLPKNIL